MYFRGITAALEQCWRVSEPAGLQESKPGETPPPAQEGGECCFLPGPAATSSRPANWPGWEQSSWWRKQLGCLIWFSSHQSSKTFVKLPVVWDCQEQTWQMEGSDHPPLQLLHPLPLPRFSCPGFRGGKWALPWPLLFWQLSCSQVKFNSDNPSKYTWHRIN